MKDSAGQKLAYVIRTMKRSSLSSSTDHGGGKRQAGLVGF